MGNSLRADNQLADVESGEASDSKRFVDSAKRLISETAHDLRSPMTSIQEAIKLVRSGELGEINADQQEILNAAVGKCDCLNQMVEEMVQMERLRTGTPRANRRWIRPSHLADPVWRFIE
jgi:K+-sensing histidine kinase KdpD